MRAAQITEFGPPERLVLTKLPDPSPGPGECLIAVEACDTLFLDTVLRAGYAPPGLAPELPWIPGNGVAGRVVAVGDGVAASWLDRTVGAHTGNRGGYAELAAVGVADLVPLPDGVDVRTAAALLHDGPTALRLAEVTRLAAGDTVLVLGASGGLGIALVQLARARAGRVVAVARGTAKLARIAALGPDAVIDGERPDWLELARAALGPGGADVILDNVGAALGPAAVGLLATGGRYSAHGAPSGGFTAPDPAEVAARQATVTGIASVQLSPVEFAELTGQAFAAAAAHRLTPVIGQTFTLARAAQAHAAIQGRSVFGKTLLLPER